MPDRITDWRSAKRACAIQKIGLDGGGMLGVVMQGGGIGNQPRREGVKTWWEVADRNVCRTEGVLASCEKKGDGN